MQEQLGFNRSHRGRIRYCGINLVVMGASFVLYYLGLFGGGVDGPLRPENMGEWLAGVGVTRHHAVVMFAAVALCAVSWNWMFNLIAHLSGRRLTCNATDPQGDVCGAPVKRVSMGENCNGQMTLYICSLGHRCKQAHFHAIRKGIVGKTIVAITVTFSLMAYFL